MDRPPGLNRPLTLDDFEKATMTVACLRQIIIDCALDLGGHVRVNPMWLTPGDGRPLQGSDWALWHALWVPFSLEARKGRVGIYEYEEAPPGEESALATL